MAQRRAICFPRGDVLLLGGTFKPGDDSRNVEVDETKRILRSHMALFDDFG